MPPPRAPEEDQRLVAAVNAGDAAAFEALFERHQAWAFGVARRLTGDDADAADVVQAVFLYLLRKFPGFELSGRLTSFLYPALVHEARAARERRGRHASDEAALAAAAGREAEPGPGAREELAAALAALPAGQREVLLLRYVDGLDEAEIAAALGIPPGTVKSRAHHALRALREDPRARDWFSGAE